MEDFLKKTGPGVLDYATFHEYGQCGHDPIPHHPLPPISTPGFALQPDCLDKSAEDTIPGGVAQVQSAIKGLKSIIGESALTGGGGADGTTNAFVSSMWYADWLAFAAKAKAVPIAMSEFRSVQRH